MINAVLIDDERPSLDELEFILKKIGNINIIGKYESVAKGIEAITKSNADIVFLDIHMPGISGINAAEIILEISPNIKIVFATAFDQYALDAFEKNAFDYILKPFSEERIKKTLNKLDNKRNNFEKDLIFSEAKESLQTLGRISVLYEDRVKVISLSEIMYFTCESSHTIVVTKDEKYNCSYSLSQMEERLDKKIFFRCHKSFIVNLSKVSEVIPWFNNTYILKLDGINMEIPVSRSKIRDIKRLFNIR